MSDIYFDPKAFGLELIWTAEADLSWEFDIAAAWGSTLSGAVYIGRDQGCSCPSPFEDFTSLDSVNGLERLDPRRGRDDLRAAILTLLDGWSKTDGYRLSDDKRAEREQAASEGADAILAWSRNRVPAIGGC